MTGYQEVLTDPSYKGQIVAMTYPHIGNYGINDQDVESSRPQVEGFVVRELSPEFSNWRARQTLEAFLADNDILGLTEIDTRALTRHIRSRGAMKAVISTVGADPTHLVKKARRSAGLIGRDLVKEGHLFGDPLLGRHCAGTVATGISLERPAFPRGGL